MGVPGVAHTFRRGVTRCRNSSRPVQLWPPLRPGNLLLIVKQERCICKTSNFDSVKAIEKLVRLFFTDHYDDEENPLLYSLKNNWMHLMKEEYDLSVSIDDFKIFILPRSLLIKFKVAKNQIIRIMCFEKIFVARSRDERRTGFLSKTPCTMVSHANCSWRN